MNLLDAVQGETPGADDAPEVDPASDRDAAADALAVAFKSGDGKQMLAALKSAMAFCDDDEEEPASSGPSLALSEILKKTGK